MRRKTTRGGYRLWFTKGGKHHPIRSAPGYDPVKAGEPPKRPVRRRKRAQGLAVRRNVGGIFGSLLGTYKESQRRKGERYTVPKRRGRCSVCRSPYHDARKHRR